MDAVQVIYGIDFSGAKDAGDKIWIAVGVPKGEGLLGMECFRAGDVIDSGNGIEDVFEALTDLVEENPNGVFGFDFPFSVPAPLIRERTWKEFVLAFTKRYKTPEAFRESCRQRMPGTELKGKTDIEAHTPFSPYNLWLYKQNYYGISKVLFPLVRAGSACVFPFDKPVADKPWILEVCPASTLKRLMQDGVPSYKGPEEHKRKNRRQIMNLVKKIGLTLGKDAALEDKIMANPGGDALDSVIAALAALCALKVRPVWSSEEFAYSIEGHVNNCSH